jgi:hypothetical protein
MALEFVSGERAFFEDMSPLTIEFIPIVCYLYIKTLYGKADN